jgi:hypothetical protein
MLCYSRHPLGVDDDLFKALMSGMEGAIDKKSQQTEDH